MSETSELRIQRPEQLVRDQVTERLRRAVLEGVFSPGDRLTERELIERTGVSRTSLREGLRQLQAEGLVEPAPGRGLRVTVLSDAEVAELYEVREYLESAAVELFVAHASDAQVTALARRLVEGAGHPDGTFDPSSNYYAMLFEGAGNALLHRLYGSISARIVMMQHLSVRSPDRSSESRRENEEIIAWIQKRNAARAVEATRHHVRQAKDRALNALRDRLGPAT